MLGIYVCARWIMDLVKLNPKISNLRADLVPFLLKRQFMSQDVSGLPHRNLYLSVMEQYCKESTLRNLFIESPKENDVAGIALEKMDLMGDNVGDFIRCFGYTCDILGESGLSVCQKLTNVQVYLNLNAFVIYRAKEHNFISNSSVVGEKVTMKYSSIGRDVKIGDKAKINNAIVMDKAEVGSGCVIHNSVICEGVKIESNSNISDCMIGKDVTIAEGSKLKDEIRSDNVL